MIRQNIKVIVKLLGETLYLFSIFHIIPSIISLVSLILFQDNREINFAILFLAISAILAALGKIFQKVEANLERVKTRPYLAACSTGLAWLIFPLLGGIVYWYGGLTLLDSLFESMSAWTTTGFTVYSDINNLPYSLRFWRSFQQWIGGLGIIIFLTFVIGKNELIYGMAKIEGREDLVEPTIKYALMRILRIYVVLTFVGAALLSFAGIDTFTAFNISMTALATGGMTPFNKLSLTLIQQLVIILLMLAGALSFGFHSMILEGKIGKAFKRYEPLRWLVTLIVLSTIIGMVNGVDILTSLFHSVSAITATGFSYENLSNIPQPYFFSLIVLMIIGGCIGSTAGGIKIDRFIILVKGIKLQLKRILLPKDANIVERYMNSIIDDKKIAISGIFFFFYTLILFSSSMLLTLHTKDFLKSIFEVASAMGNVGLEVNLVNSLPTTFKILLMINMWIGRLEIFTAFAFILSLHKIVRE